MQPSNQNQTDSLTTANVEVSDYTIANNPAAFQILSSGLYSNKIEAVIRELSCNAWDAHVSAGKRKTPIHVTLPTADHRWFVVRDEGTGLDHDEVRKLYTTYFESDKRESNKTVGGFGLGAKSPFAYNDSFTVTSWKDGIERVYTCTMPLGEEPKLIRLLEQPTEHGNGVEVKVPVKVSDLDTFRDTAAIVFFFFPVKPETNMAIDYFTFEEVKKTPLYSLGTLKVKDTANQGRTWNAFHGLRMLRTHTKVVMGTVCYPLDLNSLNLTANELNFLSGLRFMLNMPIGSINVAASREELQYDPQSRSTLERALKNMIRDMFDAVHESWTNAETVWDKSMANVQWLEEVYCPVSGNYGVQHLINSKQSVFLPMVTDYAAQQKCDPEFVKAFTRYNLNIPSTYSSDAKIRIYLHLEGEVGRKEVMDGQVHYRNKHYVKSGLLLKKNNYVVFVDNEGMAEALKEWRDQKGNPQLLVVVASKKINRDAALATAKSLSSELGDVTVKTISDLAAEANWSTNQKTVVKSQFVEIGDRMVEVTRFDGSTAQMAFKDVPASCKFVLVRNTRAKVGDSDHIYSVEWYNRVFVEGKDESIVGVNTLQTMAFFKDLYTYANEQGIDWNGPEGYLEINPVEYQRLKMDNASYPFIFVSLLNALKANTELLKATQHAWDNLQVTNGYYYQASIWKVIYTNWNTKWTKDDKDNVRQAWVGSAWEQWFEDAIVSQSAAQLKWTGNAPYLKHLTQSLSDTFTLPYKNHAEEDKRWQDKAFAGKSVDWSKLNSAQEVATMLQFVLNNTKNTP